MEIFGIEEKKYSSFSHLGIMLDILKFCSLFFFFNSVQSNNPKKCFIEYVREQNRKKKQFVNYIQKKVTDCLLLKNDSSNELKKERIFLP